MMAMMSDGRDGQQNRDIAAGCEWRPEPARLSSAMEHTPAQLARLEPALRPLALQRARDLVDLGYKQSRALCMAAAFAQEWLERGRPGEPAILDSAYYLMCEYDAWLIVPPDSQEPTDAFDGFYEALKYAHAVAASSGETLHVFDPAGTLIARYECRGAALDQRHTIHVLPCEGRWALKKPDADDLLACFHGRKTAVEAARSMAHGEEATVVVHYHGDDLQRMMYW
jgi:hypothetical protein